MINFGSNSPMGNISTGHVAGRDIINIINADAPQVYPPPFMIPPLPEDDRYVPRGQAQERLVSALRAPTRSEVIHLHGASGVGKTTMVAYAASQAQATFPDGILWESVEHYQASSDLILRLLGILDPSWYQKAPKASQLLRNLFWDLVRDKHLLIVLDNVASSASLSLVLPIDQRIPAGVCLVVIGYQRLRFPPGINTAEPISLDGLERDADIELLLTVQLGPSYVQLHREALLEVAHQVDNNPLQILSLARDLAARRKTPQALLRAIQQDAAGIAAATGGRGIEISIQDLDSTTRDLFPLLGALGASSWRADAIAAAAMCSPMALQIPLAELRERGLVQQHADGRFYLNLQARQIAHRLFEAHDRYHRDATFTCLARYFLDLAHDTAQALRVQPNIQGGSGTVMDMPDEAFIGAFRATMLPELPHLRRVFDWAIEREDWSLLLRFADVAYAGLLTFLTVTGSESRFPLTLTTVVEPLISPRGDQARVDFQTLIGAVEWSYDPTPDLPASSGSPETTATSSAHRTGTVRPLELCLSLTVGAVIDGTIEQARLVDAQWVGVRAVGLILRDCEMVGSRMVACDLRQATWCGGAAQQCDLTGTILDYALIRQVEMHRAVLRGASLKGAVLENTYLRGADLRGANLTGALLEDVDLRGADLSGALLTGAHLTNVRLTGATFEGTQWAGSTLNACTLDESVREEVVRAAHEPGSSLTPAVYRRPRQIKSFQTELRQDFPLADLRGAEIEAIVRRDVDLRGADLRAARLLNCQLEGANLEGANLRAIHFPGAALSRANLRDADLRAAILCGAVLDNAVLSRAILRGADLRGARFTHAALLAANLRGADLSGADLHGASLVDIDLRQACLRRCRLENADLVGADLSGADLAGASLRGAKLAGAYLIGTNLQDVDVTLEQLALTAQRTGLRLTNWTVMTLADEYKGADALSRERILSLAATSAVGDVAPEKVLCLAHLTGQFRDVQLAGRDLFGVEIAGVVEDSDFRSADLRHAVLRGQCNTTSFAHAQLNGARITGFMNRVDFDGASLVDACISGTLTGCTFQDADLTGVSLAGANLVGCIFTGCIGLTDELLQRANRLRGVTLHNGERYMGRFNCPGDQEDARKHDFDLASRPDQFYQPDQLTVHARPEPDPS